MSSGTFRNATAGNALEVQPETRRSTGVKTLHAGRGLGNLSLQNRPSHRVNTQALSDSGRTDDGPSSDRVVDAISITERR